MNRRVLLVLMLVCALVVLAPRAWAQWPPETHPTDQSRDIVMTWDRSAVPGDVELWAPRTVLGFSHDLAMKYGQIHVVCGSASDSEFGKCPTEGDPSLISRTSEVVLRLAEQRTGLIAEARAIGSLQRIMSGRICGNDFWDKTQRPLYSAYWSICSVGISDEPLGTGIELILPQHEISRLVNMDLRYDPIRKVVAGRKEVDMCLYDGVGSQSEFLGVTVRDSGPRPPPGRDFAVWHQDGGSDDTQRLDYQVGLNYGGNLLAMKHGEEQLLRGIDSAQLRMVLLPGISQPVYCVPTPLTLETPPTPIASKRPGLYDGELTVELRVPTAKP